MDSWKEKLGLELSVVSYKEKLISTAGGIASILILILLAELGLDGSGGHFVVASMGASAVLLFAVPHGQLSQPWPVIAGHGISAAVGVLCARYIPHQALASASAVGLAIGMMHQCKCIHPPGGATALTAVIGGPSVHDLGFGFIFFPILSNALLLVGLAVLLNACFHWRRYPAYLNHHRRRSAGAGPAPSHEEIVSALRSLDSFVDITEEDLIRLCELLSKPPPAETPSVTQKKRKVLT
ncbi:HPP family protein [Prosthecobacter dejongeii]|uniref:CBS-domain-containing membrane protein n=1 Tax=Prosthecobacter dejongeii TaxID=48465 RepID=A0A7W8DMY1_9BACT|nr:HPP family protein [Prosthecobacter dejongeii]MBB5035959.1 CBS-domain-containing membrane protein [Prosthecobacter dejongeii]